MPKKARELSPLDVKRLTRPGFHAVGGVAGLLLRVSPQSETGARSWILRVTVGDRRRDIGLGGFPDVSLAGAREKARAMREQIERGIDPVEQRKAAQRALIASHARFMTFEDAAKQCHAVKAPEFRNAKHAAQWLATQETYAFPVIGKLSVDQVETAHIHKILEPLWSTKTETATRLRQRLEATFTYAYTKLKIKRDNPAAWAGNLRELLPKPNRLKKVQHMAALPIPQMHDFMVKLHAAKGTAARALELAILTACRSGEVRGAKWSEFDFTAAVWTIPAERMKAQREHRVPLSKAAIKLLQSLERDGELVFPAPSIRQRADGEKPRPLSDMAMLKVLERLGYGEYTVHGFRSTFRDWCADYTHTPREVAELCLAHTNKDKVEAAYRRGDQLEKRAKIMQQWATFISRPMESGNVVPLQRKTRQK